MMAVIRKYDQLPFSYGADCCRFVGECVEAVTGHNPGDVFNYETEQEANAIIAAHGSLEAVITSALGAPYDGHKDGDILLYDMRNGEQILGVALGDMGIVRTKNGVTSWPLAAARAIWKT